MSYKRQNRIKILFYFYIVLIRILSDLTFCKSEVQSMWLFRFKCKYLFIAIGIVMLGCFGPYHLYNFPYHLFLKISFMHRCQISYSITPYGIGQSLAKIGIEPYLQPALTIKPDHLLVGHEITSHVIQFLKSFQGCQQYIEIILLLNFFDLYQPYRNMLGINGCQSPTPTNVNTLQIDEPRVNQVLIFEPLTIEQQILLAFLIRLEMQTIGLHLLKCDSIAIEFVFAIVHRSIHNGRWLKLLPI